jgi:hypothetical protein
MVIPCWIFADEKVADWAKIIEILRENEEPAWLGNRIVWFCAAFIGGNPHLLVLGEGFWDAALGPLGS